MSHSRRAASCLAAASLTAAIAFAASAHAAPFLPDAAPASFQAPSQTPSLAAANAALQAGEADKALALLAAMPQSGPQLAEALNLLCRVRLTLEQFDAAADACEQAVHLDSQNSNDHLWLGRALGQRAARASFVTAFSLAKHTRSEFEEAVRLDPRNAEALYTLGEFYRQAPGIVGGGVDKAQQIDAQLAKVDSSRAHILTANIAEQQKDYAAAEREFKLAISGVHPALAWTNLAGFYGRRQRFADMDSAMHSALAAALRDHHAGVALYDGAGLLAESNRNPELAATMLDDYLAGARTEEAPAFIAHIRLARLKEKLGDPAAATRERAEAFALAREYKPAQDSKYPEANP